MSRFLDARHGSLTPYTPGEQPKINKLIKLNTNESPYPPSEKAIARAAEAAARLMLYPDPECGALRRAASEYYGVAPECLLFTNGSDETLNFAFMAFCGKDKPAYFPNITYGFYPVFARISSLPHVEVPLTADMRIRPADYDGLRGAIIIANPNAPTGIALAPSDIEDILRRNPESVVVVDEAYVDFGAESCIPLIERYDNLIVTQTFSKSRSMAGARLGIGFACPELIADLRAMQYSTNPYNVNAMTMAAAMGSLEDEEYFRRNCRAIAETREETVKALRGLGFELTDSKANFIFARKPGCDGGELYSALRERGLLVRHFDKPGLSDWLRISIGSPEQMRVFVRVLGEILEGKA